MAGTMDVVVKFTGDSTKLRDDISKIAKTGDSIKRWAVGVGAAVGGAFAVGKVVEFGKSAVTAASDLNEVMSASKIILGDAADEVLAWSKNSATAIGQSQTEALNAANTFATFGKAAGKSGKDLADFSTDMTTLASDFASFRNTTPEEAITAIGAALRGENEPIRKYGILLDDATLKAKAMKLGLISTTKDALTPQQKVLAAQAAILEQSTDAQGNFALTADDLANKQRILGAQIENVKTKLGQVLLPVILTITSTISRLLFPVFEKLGTMFSALFAAFREGDVTSDGAVGVFERIGVAARALVQTFVKNWPKIRQVAIDTFERVRDIVVPIIQRLVSFVTNTLAPALAKVWDAVIKILPDVIDLFADIGQVAAKVWPKIVTVVEKLTPIVGAVVTKLVQFVGVMLRNKDVILAIAAPFAAYVATMKVMKGVSTTMTAVTKGWTAAQIALNIAMNLNPIGLIVAGIVALVAIIALLLIKFDFLETAAAAVWAAIQVAWDAILGIIQGVWNWISENWPLILAILTGPFGLAVLFITKHWDTIVEVVQGVIDWLKRNWPKILAILTGPIGLFVLAIVTHWDTIKNTFNTVKDAIIAGWQAVVDFIAKVPGWIRDTFLRLAEIITAPFRTGFNAIAKLWNSTVGSLSFRVPSFVPGLGGKGWDVPDIPELAKGGIVKETGLAVVHEGEMFSGVGRTFGNTYNINVQVAPATDPALTGRVLVEYIRAFERSNGQPVLSS